MDAFIKFRTKLLTGFSEESSKFESLLREELTQNGLAFSSMNQALQSELKSLRERASLCDQLEQENTFLRGKIERAASRPRISTPPREARSTRFPSDIGFESDRATIERNEILSTKTDNIAEANKENHQLRKEIAQLKNDYEKLKDSHLKVSEKFRKVREDVKRWQEHHNSGRRLPESTRSNASPRRRVTNTGTSNGLDMPTPPLVSRHPPNGEPQSLQVVSERSLKRKQSIPIAKRQFSTSISLLSTTESVRSPGYVKVEHISSSPFVCSEPRMIDFTYDSLDLDEVGVENFTPTKRRQLEKAIYLRSQRSRSILESTLPGPTKGNDLEKQELSTSSNPEDINKGQRTRNSTDFSESNLICSKDTLTRGVKQRIGADLDSRVSYALQGAQNLRKPRHYLHDQGIVKNRLDNKVYGADSKDCNPDATCSYYDDVRARSEPIGLYSAQENTDDGLSCERSNESTALRHISPNIQVLPQMSGPLLNKKSRLSRSRRDHGIARIPAVTEHGNDYIQSRAGTTSVSFGGDIESPLDKSQTRIGIPPEAESRLIGLLAEPSPERPLLASDIPMEVSAKAKNDSGYLERTRDQVSRENHRSKAASHKSPKPRRPGTRRETSEEHFPEPIAKQKPPGKSLRALPLKALSLDDFKINPDTNQVLDFALNKVIRKQEQRKCLPSCSKPECCGGIFRNWIATNGLTTGPKKGLWESPPEDLREEDKRLLKESTGHDANCLNSLGRTRKQDLLLDARVKQFANDYGKHKQYYERQTSPPGFWRTEMPTTQENEADRETARKLERLKVEERYKEATEKGGRWMFRDE